MAETFRKPSVIYFHSIHLNFNTQNNNYLLYFRIPDKKFKRDIEISLGVLSPQQLKQYAIFAIFPHCVGIPVTVSNNIKIKT